MCNACNLVSPIHGHVKEVLWLGETPDKITRRALAECQGDVPIRVLEKPANLIEIITENQQEELAIYASTIDAADQTALIAAKLSFSTLEVSRRDDIVPGLIKNFEVRVRHFMNGLQKVCDFYFVGLPWQKLF